MVVFAVLVGAAACLSGGDGDGKDTGFDFDSGYSGGGGDIDLDEVGDATGLHGMYVQDNECGIIWGVGGDYIGNGDDYRWDAVLLVTTETTCSGVSDKRSIIEVSGGVAYFDGIYVGAASYSADRVAWASAGYLTGMSGYTYAYDSYIEW